MGASSGAPLLKPTETRIASGFFAFRWRSFRKNSANDLLLAYRTDRGAVELKLARWFDVSEVAFTADRGAACAGGGRGDRAAQDAGGECGRNLTPVGGKQTVAQQPSLCDYNKGKDDLLLLKPGKK
jgi:hypothetical protein